MKRVAEVSMVFCGAVIGAGFVSGREILSYFAAYSLDGILGTVLLFIAFTLSVNAILQYCFQTRIYNYSDFLASIFSKRWNKLITAIVTVFLFSSFFVMASGSGVLLHQEFGWNKNIGIVILIAISFIVLLFDLRGLMKFNLVLTPILIAGIIIISFSEIVCTNAPAFLSFAKKTIFNPFSSALIYVSYNMLLATAVLVPLTKSLKYKKEAKYSALFCGGILFLTTLTVYFAMYFTYIKVLPFEIPLLYLASNMGKGIEYFYCIIILFAMLTSSVAAGYGFIEKIADDFKIPQKLTLVFMCLLSFPFATLGFANLINSLYGFFGIIGLSILIGITYRCMKKSI